MNSPIVQLLVLAAIAIFLILRLRSVLGSREGFEKPPVSLPESPVRRGRPERECLLVACAGIYSSVCAPDWVALQGGPAEVVDLPAYPWQHERHWLRQRPMGRGPAVAAPGPHGILGRRLPVAGTAVFEVQWPEAAPGWLAG